ncbi:MAG: TetR/AcrR family transcriptional regulator [Gemmatimonadales bacterium]
MTRQSRRDGDATRERLLTAALALYTTTGFLGTTTPALSTQAGVAEGTIYRHFSSKEHLLNEAYRRAQRWALGLLDTVEADRVRRAPERLTILARQIIQTAATDAPLVRMFFGEGQDSYLDDQSRAVAREVLGRLVGLVAMAKSDGQVRSGPAELWASVWLTVVGFVAERVAAGDWPADSATVTMTLEAAWDAIAARASASSVVA